MDGDSFKKLVVKLPYDPAIPLLGIYPEETITEKDACTSMFITAIFIIFAITRTWKQPRYPSTDEWVKKLWYINTMEYYSATKRSKSELVLVRWMNLEPIIQREVSQKEKNKYHILTRIYGEGNGTPLQHSRLENPMDRGARWAAVYGVAQSWKRLKRLSSSNMYIWNLERWYWWTYPQGSNEDADREKTGGYRGKERVGRTERVALKYICYHM